MTVSKLLIEGIETAGPSATAEALAMRLAEVGIGSIVIEEEMRPVGIVTDRDIAVRVAARDRPADEVTAAEIMTEDPVTVRDDAGLFAVTETMREHGVRRMPVVNDEGTLVGIITLDDVMQLLATELDNLAAVIEAESPPY
ncbi:CBS domain-containing protein [Halorientalis marina]|jgi:CBS domain-containing protein|uniref:CBS domain-containing protein n=1 Tax=Halorientalis marina TaxID=2931976 RepID=UPI001FF4E9AC|nr:CBS domain-containing protein [Halorientalis marina]